MKKLFLLLLVTMNSCIIFAEIKNKEEIERDASEYFITKLPLRNLELNLLAKECNLNHKENACKEIQQVTRKAKLDAMKYCQMRLFSEHLIIVFYVGAFFNRQDLYKQDEEILANYKEKLPEELYNLLLDFENETLLIHDECVNKKNMQACKRSFNPSELSKQVVEKMRSLKKTDLSLYMTLLNYFTEATASKSANTKSKFLDSAEKVISIIESFEVENEEEQKAYEEYVNDIKNTSNDYFKEQDLSLEEVRKKLQECE